MQPDAHHKSSDLATFDDSFIQNIYNRFLNSAQELLCDHEAARHVAESAVSRFKNHHTNEDRRTTGEKSMFIRPWTSIQDIEFDPVDPMTVYIADLEAGVFISKDCGHSWSSFNQGFKIRSCTALTISPEGSRMYAATSGAGVHKMQLRKEPMELIFPVDKQKHLLNGP